MYAQQRSQSELWDVPYLPIDPTDVGRSYEAIIRVNSQSGKGGVAYLMETEHHLELPRGLQVDFAQKVQAITDAARRRADRRRAAGALPRALPRARRGRTSSSRTPTRAPTRTGSSRSSRSTASRRRSTGVGNGPIAALVDAFARRFGIAIRLRDYHEHAMAASADATAAAYVEADVDDEPVWGVGLHPSIVTASLRAVVNAVNRAVARDGSSSAPRRRVSDRSHVGCFNRGGWYGISKVRQDGDHPDEYDQMREKLGVGDTPPAGGVFHAAAIGEDGKNPSL